MNIDLTGKRAVVAGGSRGIGRAIALAFAEAGAGVSICARGADALSKARDDIARHGHPLHAATCDLADAAAVPRYIEEAAGALGGIDILVNNASGFGGSDDEAGWAVSIAVDLMATVRATRAALPISKNPLRERSSTSRRSRVFAPRPAPRPTVRSRRRSSNIPRRRRRNSRARASASTASLPARSSFPAAPGSARRITIPTSTPRSCAASRSAGWASRRKSRASPSFSRRLSPAGSPARTSPSMAARCCEVAKRQMSKKTVSFSPCMTMSRCQVGVSLPSLRAAISVRLRAWSSIDCNTGSASLAGSPAK